MISVTEKDKALKKARVLCVCACVYMCVHTHVYVCACVYTHVRICGYVCAHVCICVHVCMHVCACAFMQFKVKDDEQEKPHREGSFWSQTEGNDEGPVRPLGGECARRVNCQVQSPRGSLDCRGWSREGPVGGVRQACGGRMGEDQELGLARSYGLTDINTVLLRSLGKILSRKITWSYMTWLLLQKYHLDVTLKTDHVQVGRGWAAGG